MSLIKELPFIREDCYRENYDLSSINWFRVGGKAEIMFRPQNVDELVIFLKNKPKHIDITILGVGSNLIVRDGGIDGVVIRLGREFSQIKLIGKYEIEVGAAALDVNVALFARDEGIAGMEFLSGIPGTIGGAIKMNAGAYGGCTSDILVQASAVDLDGNVYQFNHRDFNFVYRKNNLKGDYIFTKAILSGTQGDKEEITRKINDINHNREASQPIRARTGGSTFKNPEGGNLSAWKLIDEAGCRGLSVGGAKMSEKHCNFMISDGTATSQDLEDLGNEVIKRVKEKTGITLEWEIKIIGKKL